MPNSWALILCDFIIPAPLPVLVYHGYDLEDGVRDGEHLCLYVFVYLKTGAFSLVDAMLPYDLERLLKPALPEAGNQYYRVVADSQ